MYYLNEKVRSTILNNNNEKFVFKGVLMILVLFNNNNEEFVSWKGSNDLVASF